MLPNLHRSDGDVDLGDDAGFIDDGHIALVGQIVEEDFHRKISDSLWDIVYRVPKWILGLFASFVRASPLYQSLLIVL